MLLTLCRGDQAGHSDQADGATDVVDERCEAELAPDVLEPPHQEPKEPSAELFNSILEGLYPADTSTTSYGVLRMKGLAVRHS